MGTIKDIYVGEVVTGTGDDVRVRAKGGIIHVTGIEGMG